MSLRVATSPETDSPVAKVHLPADVDWHMLDKSRFFFLGAALFSGVSAALYPIVVLKTRQQVSQLQNSCTRTAVAIFRHGGARAFYQGFGTSLVGTIPARALYMGALEVTKSSVGAAALELGFSETKAAAAANAAAGVSSAMAAQLVWTPVDVVSQRLMVQGCGDGSGGKPIISSGSYYRYSGGFDAFRRILCTDGARGLYRGFGISIFTYAPSNAVWWASYSLAHKFMWGGIGSYSSTNGRSSGSGGGGFGPSAAVAVQGLSAVIASGASALITMPLDTIKTRMQVLGGEEKGRRAANVAETVRNLVREGGLGACYRGLGPRWASMSMSAAIMVNTYEFLKRLSTKRQ